MAILVSNRGALEGRYGVPGADSVEAALGALIKADGARGVATTLIYVDDAAKMGAAAVTNSADPPQNKTAIDHIVTTYQDDTIVIVGAPDIVPHVPLANPIEGDPDAVVPSDLPYACSTAYSTDAADYIAPTRRVSRIPGVTGQGNAQYLVDVLTFAATHASQAAMAFASYFSVSTDEWRASTALSLNAIFGNATSLSIAPPDGPVWSNSTFGRKAQFFNVHGASDDSSWYGQRGSAYPVALAAASAAGKIAPGALAATEACYGAQLYDPSGAGSAICNVYLAGGCAGFFGSTTIAYGPAATNAAADLITQYFLKEALSGNTIGDAALAARLQFVQAVGTMTPINLKTLAQFILLGHGPLTPVTPAAGPQARRASAAALASIAQELPSRTLVPREVAPTPRSRMIDNEIRVHAVTNRMRQPKTTTYIMRPASAKIFQYGTPVLSLSMPVFVHVTVDERLGFQSQRDQFAASVVEITETGGAPPQVQVYYRH